MAVVAAVVVVSPDDLARGVDAVGLGAVGAERIVERGVGIGCHVRLPLSPNYN